MKDTVNEVSVWRMADLHDAELLKGTYVRHAYPWHAHEELSLGIVVGGAINLRTRFREGTAKAGSFVLVNSDELHQGSPAAPQGWRCRTIHIMPRTIQAVAEEMRASDYAPPVWFDSPAFEDATLARAFLEFHQLSETTSSSLDRQSRILSLIARVLRCHCNMPSPGDLLLSEPEAIKRAREYLDEYLSEKVTLEELATVADLSPFRLLRAFQKTVGLSPHNYQIQARVRKAHRLLKQGVPIAGIALDVGFSDQAHFTRIYKNVMGGTPGQFRTVALPDNL